MSMSDDGDTRRAFLGTAGMIAAVSAASAKDSVADAGMPKIKLGKHTVSRLVCGNNPFNGGSHTSVLLNEEMRRYYDPEQTLKTLRRC
jgi:hypothetical protein